MSKFLNIDKIKLFGKTDTELCIINSSFIQKIEVINLEICAITMNDNQVIFTSTKLEDLNRMLNVIHVLS